MALAFDQVAIEKAAGFNLITVEEWLEMTLRDQYDLITQSKVRFLKDGEPVRTMDAVKSMRATVAGTNGKGAAGAKRSGAAGGSGSR